MQPGQRYNGGRRHLRWTVDEVAATPSRADGITDKAERMERFAACDYARNLIRALFSNEKTHEEQCNHVQVLACYYLQLFYMFRSLRQENSRIVAIAAAFLACKVVDLPRRMRSLLRTVNQQRVQSGEAEFGEEEQRRTCEQILRIEFLLLRIVQFDFDVALPLEDLVGLAERLLVALTRSEAFKKACGKGPPIQEAHALKQELLKVAERFTFDSFMGLAPLLAPPRVIAAGALAIATRYIRREMVLTELLKLLESADGSLNEADMKSVIDEILNVFRTKNAVTPPTSAAASTASTAAAPGTAQASAASSGVSVRAVASGGPPCAPAQAAPAVASEARQTAALKARGPAAANVGQDSAPAENQRTQPSLPENPAVQPPAAPANSMASDGAAQLSSAAPPLAAARKHETKDDAGAACLMPVRTAQHSERANPYPPVTR